MSPEPLNLKLCGKQLVIRVHSKLAHARVNLAVWMAPRVNLAVKVAPNKQLVIGVPGNLAHTRVNLHMAIWVASGVILNLAVKMAQTRVNLHLALWMAPKLIWLHWRQMHCTTWVQLDLIVLVTTLGALPQPAVLAGVFSSVFLHKASSSSLVPSI